ncbi:MAG: DUF3575 domain-containing protein [Cyclobacteriaceae bacterium]|nr:DUF3575 domain-containing protein [Cyclobacteriaceae bacterium]
MNKKSFILLALIALSLSAKAQFEAKINPFSILWGSIDVAAEYGFSDNFGIDLAPTIAFDKQTLDDVEYKSTRAGVVVNPRYYFSPNKGLDKFYFGGYLKYMSGAYKSDGVIGWKNERFAGGFNIGYKIVAESGFLFDIAFGGGKAFVNKNTSELDGIDLTLLDAINIDFVGKLAVGWRF